MESILNSVKKMLGITAEYTHFDTDIIMHINSVLSILTQLGIGSSAGFSISDEYTTWSDYLEDESRIEMVRSFMYMKVRLIFDPPTSSAVLEAMKQQIAEIEWRLTIAAEEDGSTTIEADCNRFWIVEWE